MQVWELLPPDLPALPPLKSLDLSGYMLREMPDSSAQSLARLTSLAWRCSPITQIPPALSLVTSLQELQFHENERLQLGPASVTPLLPLEHLTFVNLNNSRFRGGKEAVQSFTNRLPQSCVVKFRGSTYTPRE